MAKRKTWTEAEEAELADRWEAAPTVASLAAHFGRSQTALLVKGRKLGLPCRPTGGNKVINSWRDPRVAEKTKRFLNAYADLRNEGKACAHCGLNIQTYHRLRERDVEFARRAAMVEAWLETTLKCTVCQKVGHPDEFVPNKNKVRRTAICHSCMNARTRDYGNTLRGRLSRVMAQAKSHQKDRCGTSAGFDLTLDYLVHMYESQEGCCYYTGRRLVHDTATHGPLAAALVSLDRKDPRLGYTKQNVVLCCWEINQMKNDAAHDQFLEVCTRISNLHP